uniref:Sulfotransferase n=1 Tax=Ciona savignyi TaxID=51511 RepID=H2Z0Q8_CIOSA
MPPSFFFEQFHKRWPKAKVILTIRDETDWFKSIQKMNKLVFNNYYWMTYFSSTAEKFNSFMRKLYQCMLGDGIENSWLWKMHYRRHNTYVQQVIPSDTLLVLDVADGWAPLCKFLNKPIPDDPFPFVNAAGTKGNIVERLLGESKIARKAKIEIVFCIIFYLFLAAAFVYILKDCIF